MSGFLSLAGLFILLTVLLGLVRILRGPGDDQRLMAVQLLGSGGLAALLLLGSVIDLTGATDLALLLALLAAFAAVALVAGLGAGSASLGDQGQGSAPGAPGRSPPPARHTWP
ncbi:putative monovalent cation/H+ antiporter subunit F [Thiorhodovibrio winogradskyi]|uniref:Monovalent cation/H+ antiporter subunit F n=1 Tax=Thiorhodovibrio winogradskyi TaxID=77007 RepID=A0ABZ0SA64_9GAMM|nr:sodium:proton antiporter [Thiorhodovibrio winogradskyi]